MPINPKILLFIFNPLGINQERNKNQIIIEKLKSLCRIDHKNILNRSNPQVSENLNINRYDSLSYYNQSMTNSMIIEKVYNITN